MRQTVFNQTQLHLLEMFKYCKTEESINELKKVLADYYAHQVQQEADRLWDEGILDENAIEDLLKQHLRASQKSQ
jgi:hypothetical protein